jgi:hypothetical protein
VAHAIKDGQNRSDPQQERGAHSKSPLPAGVSLSAPSQDVCTCRCRYWHQPEFNDVLLRIHALILLVDSAPRRLHLVPVFAQIRSARKIPVQRTGWLVKSAEPENEEATIEKKAAEEVSLLD